MAVVIRRNHREERERRFREDTERGAFTLIEVLCALALIAILTGIALPALRGIRDRMATARTCSELALLAQALEEFRRQYGDYPQTGDFVQASSETAQALETSHAQAKFFNALTGAFGPRLFATHQRINGRSFVDLAKLSLERTPTADFQVPRGYPPQKSEEQTCFLDPWGRRYFYYYKPASDPEGWQAVSYILYSAGPDGLETPPEPQTGRTPVSGPVFAVNADNVYANFYPR